jgi:hypothetical protein
MLFLVAISASLSIGAHGSSMFIASKCRGQKCTDPNFPILDYVPEDDKCVCAAHPCWNDNGRQHECSLESGLHLAFSYTADGKLTCSCSATAHYSSVHVARDLCAGHHCALPDFPILDWDPDAQQCFCRANPCWISEGSREQCNDPLKPILFYREDFAVNDAVQPVCECIARANKPQLKESRLRGSSNESRSKIMIMSNGERCVMPTRRRSGTSALW